MHNSGGVVWHTAPAEGIRKVSAAINPPQFFPSQGAAAASKDSPRTPSPPQKKQDIQMTRTCFRCLNLIAQLTVLSCCFFLNIYNVDCVLLSLNDGVEIRRVVSPPLISVPGTLYCTVLCSVLFFCPFEPTTVI